MIPFLTHVLPRSSISKGCTFPAPNRLSFPSPYVFVYVCTCLVYKFIVFPVKYSSMRTTNYSKILHETCRLRVFRVYEARGGGGGGVKSDKRGKDNSTCDPFCFSYRQVCINRPASIEVSCKNHSRSKPV